jgi:acetyltransferase-like isoleucine patch superfamily enzyme
MKIIKELLKSPLSFYLKWLYTFLKYLTTHKNTFIHYMAQVNHSKISNNVHIYDYCIINNSKLDEYTYISSKTSIYNCSIGRYCSVGPNVLIGPGSHPTDKISTSPVFYSNRMQVGISTCKDNIYEEVKEVNIGNDVWIGANVIILDGVTIGNGVIIAANSVVTKSFDDFQIIGGSPAKLIKERFTEEKSKLIISSSWWNYSPIKAESIQKELH